MKDLVLHFNFPQIDYIDKEGRMVLKEDTNSNYLYVPEGNTYKILDKDDLSFKGYVRVEE